MGLVGVLFSFCLARFIDSAPKRALPDMMGLLSCVINVLMLIRRMGEFREKLLIGILFNRGFFLNGGKAADGIDDNCWIITRS